jgi:hypothetical protein
MSVPDLGGGWDWAGEAVLATRPMPMLPPSAAAPRPLATRPAPGMLRLPSATGELAVVPAGFPPTPPGAVAALAALTTYGLSGGDPAIYAADYAAASAPGAPAPRTARLVDLLSSIRATAGLPPTGPVPDLTMTWQLTEGQVKGVLDEGRYAVVCVLGQFSATYQGRVLADGVGDCQALRWVSGQWRISPGPAAATASDAWPGSQDAVNAGYQEVQQ